MAAIRPTLLAIVRRRLSLWPRLKHACCSNVLCQVKVSNKVDSLKLKVDSLEDFGNAFVQECASLSGITVSVPSAAAATSTTAAMVTLAPSSSTVTVTSAVASNLAVTISSVPTMTATNPMSSSALPSEHINTLMTSSVASTQVGTSVMMASTTASSSMVPSKDFSTMATISGPSTTMISSTSLSSTPEGSSTPASTASASLISISPTISITATKTTMFIPITIPTKLSTVTNPSVLVSFFVQSAILSTSSVVPPSSSAIASVTTLVGLNPSGTNGTATGASTESVPIGLLLALSV
ncbi:hypothetical protein MMC15_001293 [Xylographa vitiligo]|nr:hypothetical protein [Xylographa vitiligo]